MAEQDFYQVLGVARDADQDTIKKAYRKLAVQFHPDKNPGDKAAEEKFKEAASAYEILGNPEKRSQYDRFGHEAFTRARQGGGGHQGFHDMDDIFSSFSDIFGDFFGQGGGRQGQRQRRSGPQRGADLRYRCDISLKEVVQGAEKEIEFETEDACGECHGTGAQAGTHAETCTTCGGAGQVISQQGFFQMATTCPTCRGSGQIVRNPCRKCHGKGRQKAKRKIRVNIPAGVDTGTQLRVSGEGEGGSRGGPAGDLYVELRVKDDKRFERHGLDLVSLVEVSYLQALLGAEVEVETFDGAQTITIPNGTSDGDPVRLDGKGIPSLRGAKRGDLVFQVKVNFPKKLKKDEEKLLREIAELKGERVLDSKKGLFR